MTTVEFEAPFTLSRYLTAAAADLRVYFPGITVLVADDDGVNDLAGPTIILYDTGIEQARQDWMRVGIEAVLYAQGAVAAEMGAELYAWAYRRGVSYPAAAPTMTRDDYSPASGLAPRRVAWTLDLPNDYTLRPLAGDEFVVREITINLVGVDEAPLGEVVLT